jgi:hypothetical protein
MDEHLSAAMIFTAALLSNNARGRGNVLHCRAYSTQIASGDPLAKPNYQFEKRQRDLEKKKKKEEKAQRKQAKDVTPENGQSLSPDTNVDSNTESPAAD